jgi:hypothetical protein
MNVVAFAPVDARLRVPLSAGLDDPELIAFPPGQRSAAVAGGVVRTERDLYVIVVRAGQRLSLSIDDPEGNAAFALYEPGASIRHGAYGIEVDGLPLTEGAGMVDCWSGEAHRTGPYLVVVGAVRGNASYILRACLD